MATPLHRSRAYCSPSLPRHRCLHRDRRLPDGAARASAHRPAPRAGAVASRDVHARRMERPARVRAPTRSPPRGPRSSSVAARCSPTRRRNRSGRRRARQRARIDGASDDAVRAFFAAHFSPYRVAADGRQRRRASSPATTSRCSPARARARAVTRSRCTRRPTICCRSTSSDLHPELKDKRVRGRVEGRKVVPYWSRAELEREPRRRSPARRSCMSPIRSRRSFSRSRDRDASRSPTASVMRLNYADQNGHPYRSIGARADRSRRAYARARVDAGHQRVGEGESGQGCARSSTRIRATCSFAKCRAGAGIARRRDRRAAGHARRAAARGTHDRRRRARHPARRAGVSRHDAAAVRRRRSRGSRSRRTRAARFAARCAPISSGASAPQAGREAGRMRQDGRMWLLWPKGAPLP